MVIVYVVCDWEEERYAISRNLRVILRGTKTGLLGASQCSNERKLSTLLCFMIKKKRLSYSSDNGMYYLYNHKREK
jgi:hypothetical protein